MSIQSRQTGQGVPTRKKKPLTQTVGVKCSFQHGNSPPCTAPPMLSYMYYTNSSRKFTCSHNI